MCPQHWRRSGFRFFNCSAASLLSKFHGESEKMVKTLFDMARHHAPSVVFFDEIEYCTLLLEFN